ncbi:MAG: type II secretion system F family protein [Nocardioidaceae bacterium]
MTLAMWGLLLGVAAGSGLLLIGSRIHAMRRSEFAWRVLPYLADVPELGSPVLGEKRPLRALLGRAAARLDEILGGNSSIRRRIERAGLDLTVQDFRVQQLTWGLISGGVVAAGSVVLAADVPGRVLPLLMLCGIAFVFGLLLRDNRLTAQVNRHEQRVLDEFPAVAELLALAVAAGEGPIAALERVVRRSHGAMAYELSRVLGDVRAGSTVSQALDELARRTGQPVVARFAAGLAVALERGTPLADVLHAQAGDVREARRRDLIESGARREVLMMVPVVFLVLPVTIFFAFWPGAVGLNLVTP